MDILWKKESNEEDALYVDIFKNIAIEQPDDYQSMCNMVSIDSKLKSSPIFRLQFLESRNDTKNISVSTKHRQDGNSKFKEQKWLEAMNLYNKSLCFAPIDSENVSLAYANRSSCFLQLKMYEKCLIDIYLAIKANYPEHLMPKLLKRRADCLKLEGNGDQRKEYVPKLSYEANKNYPAIVNGLNIEKIDGFGRGILASKNMGVGKTVMAEEAIVSKYMSAETIVCTVCMKEAANFIPCEFCPKALFCSRVCMNENNIHKIECGIWFDMHADLELTRRLIFGGMEIFPNADDWIAFVENAVKENPGPSSLTDRKSKYKAILQLNMLPNKFSEHTVLSYQIYCTLLLHDSINKMFDTERKKRFLMHLVLHTFVILGSNIFKETDQRNAFILLSYFNHSCVPNLYVFFHENKVFGITLRPIKRGEQLFITYKYSGYGAFIGPTDKNFFSREFGFHCTCEKCESDQSAMSSNSLNFIQDPEFQIVNKTFQKNPKKGFKKVELKDLHRRLRKILNKFGNMGWCHELGRMMGLYTGLVSEHLELLE